MIKSTDLRKKMKMHLPELIIFFFRHHGVTDCSGWVGTVSVFRVRQTWV